MASEPTPRGRSERRPIREEQRMRRLIITENITVDGVVENDGTWFDPTDDSPQGRELAEVTREHAAASDGFLVGRVTFEEMREFWPRQIDDSTGVTDHLNRVEKYVVSQKLVDPGWAGTTVLRGGDGLAEEIHQLKARAGSDIVLTGSISLAQELLRLGVVDELRLFVYPVVVGTGRRLIPEGARMQWLELLEQRRFSGGVTLVRYGVS
jgi:dihydrofolate reductase